MCKDNQKYAVYIGRWQTWHPGHEWLIGQKLNKGVPVLIMIRDVEPDENNPKSAMQIAQELREVYSEEYEQNMVRVMVIPDIESVNYGRGVGYDVIEHRPPEDIKKISGTSIRAKENKDD
jgi:nicotinamide mononucleotide adenylyltransferase